MLVQLLGQTRIFFSMGRDGLLPPLFGAVHPRFRTPHLSTSLTAVVVALGAGLVPIGVLGQLVSMGTLLAFVLVCLGILLLRRLEPDRPRPFRTPGLPWVPLAGAAVCLVQMASLPLATWGRLFVWLVAGLAIYFSYGRRRARLRRETRTDVAA
jgi:APA family basic amino acid/polyamine antiporter